MCEQYSNLSPTFALQIDVNGENASPLYKFLKLGKWGIFGDDIQWNFAKFLVNKDGQVDGRYYPTTSPLSLEVTEKNTTGNVLESLVSFSYAGFCWYIVGNVKPFNVFAA